MYFIFLVHIHIMTRVYTLDDNNNNSRRESVTEYHSNQSMLREFLVYLCPKEIPMECLCTPLPPCVGLMYSKLHS